MKVVVMIGGTHSMVKADLNVEVFADGADIEEMKAAYKNNEVDGRNGLSLFQYDNM